MIYRLATMRTCVEIADDVLEGRCLRENLPGIGIWSLESECQRERCLWYMLLKR